MQKKTLAKEKHTSRSRSTPDRRRANTRSAALFTSLGTCARKLAFAQTVRACAAALPPVPSPLSESSVVCAAACGGWCADLQLGFFRRAICESSYEFDVFHQANAVRHCKPNIKLNLMFNIRSTPHPSRLRRAAFPSRGRLKAD